MFEPHSQEMAALSEGRGNRKHTYTHKEDLKMFEGKVRVTAL